MMVGQGRESAIQNVAQFHRIRRAGRSQRDCHSAPSFLPDFCNWDCGWWAELREAPAGQRRGSSYAPSADARMLLIASSSQAGGGNAAAAGIVIEARLWSMEDVVALIDEQAERSAPRLA